MGKKIIIKGADFSANGFPGEPSYYQGNTKLEDKQLSSIAASIKTVAIGLKLKEALNKPINCIKLAVKDTMLEKTFSVFRASVGDSTQSSFTSLKDFTISANDVVKGYVIVVLNETVTITNDSETLMVGVINNTSGNEVTILPHYQVDAEAKYTYFQARGTQTEIIELTNNQARWIMSYGII